MALYRLQIYKCDKPLFWGWFAVMLCGWEVCYLDKVVSMQRPKRK